MSEQKEKSPPVLGKRKLRDGETQPGSTLFVSNLPYTATSTDLQTLFSDFGPVRSAFVVLEGTASKGVGYVSFAIKDDATKAIETIEKDALMIDGRKLRVQLADRKPKEKGSDEKIKTEHKAPATPKQSFPKPTKDPDAIRTVVISGLPRSVDQKGLWKKVRKSDGAVSAEILDIEKGVAHVLFSTPAAAAHAVDRLHAHVFKGSILSVTLKKRLENLAKTPSKTSRGEGAPTRGNRLIIRNLPWDITEQDLRALFLPFGPIYSITIPADSSQSLEGASLRKPRARGFAFVWFFSKKDAENAIEGVNGRAVAAGAITAPTMNKKERARLRRKLREQAKGGSKDERQEGETEGNGEGEEKEETEHTVEASKTEARVVAVDWALSKEKWEEAKAKAAENEVEYDEVDGEISTQEKAPESSESEEDVEDEGESDPDDATSSEMDVDERSDDERAGKPMLPQTDVGTTLFVRNVPFDATEDELRTLFRTFGPLRYARITMDVSTGRSRGTGFVCFWQKEDADKAIHQSELLSRETGIEAPKKNPFSLPSILTPDPSSSLAQSLVLHGRTLDVTRAVTRDEAIKLKDEGERQREKADKRNLYLLREGVIFPNSPAAASLTPAELEKRTISFNTRRALLKSNPALYVSKTRLSIRQLPLFTTEKTLKKLAIHAVRTFEKDVKAGTRQPLNEDELRDIIEELEPEQSEPEDDGNSKLQKPKGKGKANGRDSGVKQAKIVRQSDRIDPMTGKGKSKGYGFLEMTRHSDALRVLRWANNNPAIGQLLEEWWKAEVEELIKRLSVPNGKKEKGEIENEDVGARLTRLKDELEQLKSGGGRKGRKTLVIEFSIENAQVINRRKEKREKMSSKPKRAGNLDDAEEDDEIKPVKRRKLGVGPPQKDGSAKLTSNPVVSKPHRESGDLGSMIGRKRKMRKMKSKA